MTDVFDVFPDLEWNVATVGEQTYWVADPYQIVSERDDEYLLGVMGDETLVGLAVLVTLKAAQDLANEIHRKIAGVLTTDDI